MKETKGTDDHSEPKITVPDHELLEPIGGGSYGEVWLARSVTGAQRAIKIVRRRYFDCARPYDREFEGLLHFEPLSRRHEGLVDILQVGRSADGESFYCVMELADNAITSHPPTPSSATTGTGYQPLTLETLIRQRGGRAPVQECVALTIKLAEALRFLHEGGLAHRDIKPSNIIFVGGEPKLADVGLVARTDSTRTFVGTDGFVPPEGAGGPQADLYSLGKCLYEMAMGKDRQAFPSPPTQLAEMPERAELLELNDIITKACEPDPADRYRTAAALIHDLSWLQAGKSLRRARERRKTLRLCAMLGLLTVLLAGVTAFFVCHRSVNSSLLQLTNEFSLPVGSAANLVADFHGDGTLQVVVTSADGQMRLCAPDGTTVASGRVNGEAVTDCCVNLIAAPSEEDRKFVYASWCEGTNLYIGSFNERLREQTALRLHVPGTLFTNKNGVVKLETYFAPVAYRPPTNGSPAQLFVQLSSGFAPAGQKGPREWRCYNADKTTELWTLPFASGMGECPPIPNPQINPDIAWLVAGGSTDNGVILPDEDDAHSYLKALAEDGRPLWKLAVGGAFTSCFPLVVPLREGNTIFGMVHRAVEVSWQTTNELSALGSVFRVNPDGKQVARYDAPANEEFSTLSACDINSDGQPELLATDSQGLLHVLDPDLKPLRKLRVAPAPPSTNHYDLFLAVPPADLDGDGRQEMAFLYTQVEFLSGREYRHIEAFNNRRYVEPTLVVYDNALQVRARFQIAPEASKAFSIMLAPRDRERHRSIVVVGAKAQFFAYGHRLNR